MGDGSCRRLGGTPMGRIRQFAVTSLLAVSAFAAAPVAANAASCAGADNAPSSMSRSAANRATLCLLNEQRRAHGLRALKLDRKLGRAAAGHARDMVAQHFFAHESRNGATFGSR